MLKATCKCNFVRHGRIPSTPDRTTLHFPISLVFHTQSHCPSGLLGLLIFASLIVKKLYHTIDLISIALIISEVEYFSHISVPEINLYGIIYSFVCPLFYQILFLPLLIVKNSLCIKKSAFCL